MKKKYKLEIYKYDFRDSSKEEISTVKRALLDINQKRWKWEYKKSPKEGYAFLAKINDRVVAHYSFIVCQFYNRKCTIRVAKSEGSFADNNLVRSITDKKVKVFSEIVVAAMKELKKKNIDLVYGFPNNLGHNAYKKGGFELKIIPLYISLAIINFLDFYVNKKKKLNPIKLLFIKIISFFWRKLLNIFLKVVIRSNFSDFRDLKKEDGKLISQLFNTYANNYNEEYALALRNWKYYQWRFKDNPYEQYRIYGYFKKNKLLGIVVFNIKKQFSGSSMEIKDLVFEDKYDLKKMLLFSLKWAIKNNISNIILWEDEFLYKKIPRYIFWFSAFLRSGIRTDKTLIFKVFNRKLKKLKVKIELKKGLERK